ncbi:MAG: HAD-IA family hydrolase [Polyangiaceae bacterium]|nr:HAD-IA family hydrolase [Polyangiaceae bacterium]
MTASPTLALGFDLDGTLVDSLEDIRAALNACLRELGKSEVDSRAARGFIGDGATLLLARALGWQHDEPRLPQLVERFQEHYAQAPARHNRWMPGAEAALALGERLGVPLGICTNKPRKATLALLQALDVERHLSGLVCGGDLPEKKPDPAPILALAEQLSVSPGQLVFVGDGPQDVLAAKAAGAISVGVLGGIADEARLREAEPDHLLRDLIGVERLLSALTPQ